MLSAVRSVTAEGRTGIYGQARGPAAAHCCRGPPRRHAQPGHPGVARAPRRRRSVSPCSLIMIFPGTPVSRLLQTYAGIEMVARAAGQQRGNTGLAGLLPAKRELHNQNCAAQLNRTKRHVMQAVL